MALTDQALTTYATVRDILGLSGTDNQSLIEYYIEVASAEISRLAGGRIFHYEADIVDKVPGFGDHRLILPRAPLVSVSEIILLAQDGTTSSTLEADSYEVEDAKAGILFRTSTWPWTAQPGPTIRGEPMSGTERRSVQVTYTAGWVTPNLVGGALTRNLPYDLEQACVIGAVALYRRSGKDTSILSESSAGGSSVSYRATYSNAGSIEVLLPASVEAIARSYARSWVP